MQQKAAIKIAHKAGVTVCSRLTVAIINGLKKILHYISLEK